MASLPSEHKPQEAYNHDTLCTSQPEIAIKGTDSTARDSPSLPFKKTQGTRLTWPRIIKTNPDGRCFFRSLVIGMDPTLQSAERDENNRPTSPLLSIKEQCQSDSLRAQLIQYMCDNFSNFDEIHGDMLNADMPQKLRYHSLEERLATMANPTEMPGEFEIATTCNVIRRPIIVTDQNNDVISKYGEQDFGQAAPLYICFSQLHEDVGHFDCCLMK